MITHEIARRAMDAKTKPLGALGRLEDIAVRLAVLQNSLRPMIAATRVCIFAADHGVAHEGVSAYPRAVTGEMMRNFARGGAAINVIAAVSNVSVEVIDVGVDADLGSLPGIRNEKIRPGSRNFLAEPAMTECELDAALDVGASAVRRAADAGVHAIGLGEMGIGNTTSSAALLSILTAQPPEQTVGRGTGVDDATLDHKRSIVEKALMRHGSSLSSSCDAREALRRVGGLEIAAIAGATLEASRRRIAVVADGFISTVAVLCAEGMASSPEEARSLYEAVFVAHQSAERGHGLALLSMSTRGGYDATPLLDFGMRLGEGSGAALAMPVLCAAAAVMREMATFESAGVSAGDRATIHADVEPL